MKRRSGFAMFTVGFLKTVAVMGLLMAVAFVSYQLTKLYYKSSEAPSDSKIKRAILNIIDDAKVEDVSKNLLYCVDTEKNKINNVVLEIFNTKTNNLDYITIPSKMEFTMSNDIFQKICGKNPDVPQIIRMTDLKQYFKGESAYQYGMILMKDVLGINVNTYTEIPKEEFKKIFETKTYQMNFEPEDLETEEKDTSLPQPSAGLEVQTPVQENFSIQVFTDTLKEQASALTDSDIIKDYIENFYKKAKSNLSLRNKLKYANAYLRIDLKLVHFHSVYGIKKQTGFVMDKTATKKLLEKLLKNQSYTQEQLLTEASEVSEVSSKGKTIKILNSSKRNGLAATYEQQLKQDGFMVTGVGDYAKEMLSNTKILVKDGSYGQDLQRYFKQPVIEVGDTQGVDILIILGTADIK